MIKINRALLIFNFDVCFMPSPPCRLRVPASPARRAQLCIRRVPGAGPPLPAPSGSYCLCFIRSLVNPALPLLALILVSLGPELI